mmetsp:Transcript_114816/g.357626  ORF Transcript_114816/g.357626 Transcript_114816/m.357626 type:complete len:342 (+) Transcript_114816:96-1121(+)|eukprot:CAMPEP_0204573300 /NCGR_PEP_ID=MMETSP0661-20131031/39939_1 /ASSEMBLY_ACC=CAM_ASM_000606 /TAXON_ID=109239 /ORGANISM="Alexandrium margalefi, Strain AMGDE01CS-322" /LENGTH=341 /DNA_ID=CAMNT_0051581709 /DNA_START=78 /DNA_END=1103 /DNA_ORIENTATION=-
MKRCLNAIALHRPLAGKAGAATEAAKESDGAGKGGFAPVAEEEEACATDNCSVTCSTVSPPSALVTQQDPCVTDSSSVTQPCSTSSPAKEEEGGEEAFDEEDPRLAKTIELAELLLPHKEMTQWQRAWCTTANVSRFLRGRRGDPLEAAKILAQALLWRQEFEEVLSGHRVPRWQGDLRVIARGEKGHTIAYGCFRHMPSTKNSKDAVDHMAAMLEAWHSNLCHGATQGDIVLDCVGFRLLDNLQPAILLALVRAIQQPFRDCLRTAVVVEAPRSFEVVWRHAAPLLRKATKDKIQFRSLEAAVELVSAAHGGQAAKKLERVMRLNRTAEGCKLLKLPSEI